MTNLIRLFVHRPCGPKRRRAAAFLGLLPIGLLTAPIAPAIAAELPHATVSIEASVRPAPTVTVEASVLPAQVPSTGPTFKVANTGGIGVRLRNTPHFNDIKSNGPGEGAAVTLYCQDWGDAVGTRSNKVWNYISWNGTVGWVPDAYVNTPTVANQLYSGVPLCSAPAPATPTSTPVPVTPTAPSSDRLVVNQTLSTNQSIRSADGRFTLVQQADTNLVLYGPGGATWNTGGRGANRLVLQSDGNLVAYTPANKAVWASNTVGSGANVLVVQSDGNLVLYSPSRAVWASNTAGSTGGQTVGQRAADIALRYVGQWGGNACIDAHLGSGGVVAGYSGGQCKQFFNCVMYMASNGRINPVNYAQSGAVQVSAADARRGDVIQTTGPHTAIILENLGGGRFSVVDSNYNYDEIVRGPHDYTPAGYVIWRFNQTA